MLKELLFTKTSLLLIKKRLQPVSYSVHAISSYKMANLRCNGIKPIFLEKQEISLATSQLLAAYLYFCVWLVMKDPEYTFPYDDNK